MLTRSAPPRLLVWAQSGWRGWGGQWQSRWLRLLPAWCQWALHQLSWRLPWLFLQEEQQVFLQPRMGSTWWSGSPHSNRRPRSASQ